MVSCEALSWFSFYKKLFTFEKLSCFIRIIDSIKANHFTRLVYSVRYGNMLNGRDLNVTSFFLLQVVLLAVLYALGFDIYTAVDMINRIAPINTYLGDADQRQVCANFKKLNQPIE